MEGASVMRGFVHATFAVAVSLVCPVVSGAVSGAETPVIDTNASEILVVVGAAGNQEYGTEFSDWLSGWKEVAKASGAALTTIDGSGDTDSKDQLQAWIEARSVDFKSLDYKPSTSATAQSPIWIVLIGHGTYARETAKFNLQGLDVSATELSNWLKSVERLVTVVNCASASGPFVNHLSSSNRVIVTSTKSGNEQNFSRFGKYFAAAIASTESDLDHDDEVSIQEAFLKASAEVQKFYDANSRIATEHALIDDNGDGKGTPAKMFRGVRAIGTAKNGEKLDGITAAKLTLSPSGKRLNLLPSEFKKRESIESELESLRNKKPSMSEADYFAAIEPLMIELAKIYKDAEARIDE
ncbi:hypothetical protein [Rubripirellula reticaptiva]|uniref:Caspase domain protein n=1 Tax=Rubripirellula reticaptiva TaxID=2528013 RepID=A0A5C6EQI2_9BACT|nr:hypothetical protein [Rubripirellula reticaptiva]TWU51178.1 hypothetical protein Poly59_27690 [Rubripirellula reticaptiva]